MIASRARSFVIGFAIIATVALAVRVAFVVLADPEVPRIGDASAYHLLAENLAAGRGYIRPFDFTLLGRVRPTAEYPPLFPALLTLPPLVGAHSVEAQRLFLSVVGTGTVVLVGLLGLRVGGRRAGLLAALLAAVSPMLFLSEAVVMAEALFVPLVVVLLLVTYRALDHPDVATFVALGATMGFATLTRAEGLLLGIVLVAMLLARATTVSPASRVRLAAIALGVAALVIVPWTVRNAVQLDAFVPVSNNAATLVDGANCDPVYRGPPIGLWRETFSTTTADAPSRPQADACFQGFDIADPGFDEADVARTHLREGLTYAEDHVEAAPRVMAVRALRTWGLYAPRQQIDFESLEGRPRAWQAAGTVLDWVLLPFAIGGIAVLVRRHVAVWPLLSTAVAVTITTTLTYGQQRFRVAAEPALLVSAAVAFDAVAAQFRARVVRRDPEQAASGAAPASGRSARTPERAT